MIGIVALIIYGCQLKEMQRSSKAAITGLALSEQMNRIEERAWVAPAGISGDLEVGKEFRPQVVFKNSGKTFALRMASSIKIELVKKGSDPNFDRVKEPSKVDDIWSSVLLPPNGQCGSLPDPLEKSPFSQEQIDSIRDTQSLFVYGRVSYADIFGHYHWTTFCYLYDVREKTYGYYNKYNEADEDKE
ncbi:MAG TPA: hypothetical protein VGI60_05020 [Chthoniobacterales bacterium]|jgi:hypothetical protein